LSFQGDLTLTIFPYRKQNNRSAIIKRAMRISKIWFIISQHELKFKPSQMSGEFTNVWLIYRHSI